MKSTEQIQEAIVAKEAELATLVASHQAMVVEFNQRSVQNQSAADRLQGAIATLKEFAAEAEV